MPVSIVRLFAAPLLAAILAVGLSGCGSESESSSPGMPQIKAMRFAGADLEYALERVAAEAGMPLALDEISPKDMSPDLGLYRVDVDLPAGPVDRALQQLKQNAGGFDFEILDGVIYVRSQLLVTAKTPLDLPLLPETKFEGSIEDLVKLVLSSAPSSFMTTQRVQGGPVTPMVKFDIPAGSSVRDAFLQYARLGKLGWIIHRAGYVVDDKTYGKAIVGTTIEPRRPRTGISRRPQIFNKMSTVGALALVSERLKAPMVVLDRTVLLDTRGFLNLSVQMDLKLPLVEALNDLGESGWGPQAWHFKWKMEDGVPVIESSRFLYNLQGRDLFRDELLAGEFEGSLPEFARWLNTHFKKPSGAVFMGGEIVDGLPRGKITIPSGTTVQQALVAFAKASGVSEYVTLLDMTNPLTGKLVTHPNAWRGAYLQDLAEWTPTPEEIANP